MPTEPTPDDIAAAMQEMNTSVAALREIRAVCVRESWRHVNDALEYGIVLLGVAGAKEDENDPFRFLLGLPRGIPMNAYLEHLFPGVTD